MTALVVLEGVVILLLLILVAGLLKSHAEILRQLHRLGASTESDLETITERFTSALEACLVAVRRDAA